jgi:hypothetical protein
MRSTTKEHGVYRSIIEYDKSHGSKRTMLPKPTTSIAIAIYSILAWFVISFPSTRSHATTLFASSLGPTSQHQLNKEQQGAYQGPPTTYYLVLLQAAPPPFGGLNWV